MDLHEKNHAPRALPSTDAQNSEMRNGSPSAVASNIFRRKVSIDSQQVFL